jgi:DNA-binding transcriptional ArsR family regulator
MKKIYIEGQVCVGPHFTSAEFSLIRQNLDRQKGLETLADLFLLGGNVQRLKILYLLYAHKEMCVCDITEVLGMTDSAVSQHLRKLKDKNLVRTRRDSQTIYYSLVPNVFTAHIGELLARSETKQLHSFMYKENVK